MRKAKLFLVLLLLAVIAAAAFFLIPRTLRNEAVGKLPAEEISSAEITILAGINGKESYRSEDPALVSDLLDALNENHVRPSLSGRETLNLDASSFLLSLNTEDGIYSVRSNGGDRIAVRRDCFDGSRQLLFYRGSAAAVHDSIVRVLIRYGFVSQTCDSY